MESLPPPVIILIFLGILLGLCLVGFVSVKGLLFLVNKIDTFLDRRRSGTNPFWRVVFAVTNELGGEA